MTEYSVTLTIDGDTRDFLRGHTYSLYLFKGIDAGSGAISTVWQVINGSTLYDNEIINIKWDENYYIGKTSTKLESGAEITGVNPYIQKKDIRAVELGKSYIYEGMNWTRDPKIVPIQSAFFIENKPEQINHFYVSQKASTEGQGHDDYIVVQEILGSDGNASFTPIQVIALILSTTAKQKGAIITQAFSPGAIITLVGKQSTEISYNKDTGWSGPSGDFRKLGSDNPIYSSMLNSSRIALKAVHNQLNKNTRQGQLIASKTTSWEADEKFNTLSFSWADPKNPGTGQVSVKIPKDGSASSQNVPKEKINVENQSGSITNNTTKTINYKLE